MKIIFATSTTREVFTNRAISIDHASIETLSNVFEIKNRAQQSITFDYDCLDAMILALQQIQKSRE